MTDLTLLIPGTGLIPDLLLQALGLNMSRNSRFIFSQKFHFKLTYRLKFTYRLNFHYKLISLQIMIEWIVFKTPKLFFPYSAISALLVPSPNLFIFFFFFYWFLRVNRVKLRLLFGVCCCFPCTWNFSKSPVLNLR